jgi:hypothetical protein
MSGAVTVPNFFVVGAPKAGTTSLYRYLDQHPQIYMSPIKEPHYLADEIRIEAFEGEMQRAAIARSADLRNYLNGPVTEKFSGGPIEEWQDYLKLFTHALGHTAIGEASTCYLWSPTAATNIHRHFPTAGIIMVLRDPADRAFAQYVHMLSFAKKTIAFAEHMDASLRATTKRVSELYPFLDFGLYFEQVRRYLSLFPRERVHLCFYEDYQREPMTFLQDIFRFLGVNRAFQPDMSEKHMQARVPQSHAVNNWLKRVGLWQLIRNVSPPGFRAGLRRLAFRPRGELRLNEADRARLVAFYRDDVQNLSALLKRDLSAWLG